MAYREIAMWEVLEVLRRIARGERQRPIARATGHSRTTVRRYERAARELGWVPGEVEPGEALAVAVLAALRPGAKERDPGASESVLEPHQSRLQAWLVPEDGSRGLKLSKVHQLLSREGVEIPYSSLHRFAVRHCGFADSRRVTVRMAESAPGEVAEIDFGRLGLVYDPVTQKRRFHHALIVTLLHSRHQYVHVCISQKLEDVIEGLEAAWAFFGGVVARVVLDNMKAAVTKADRYDPVFQRVFAEYSDYRGFVIDAAIARHPTGKPTVERSVQYVRENFFRGEQWIDRDHVQREAERWCREIAGQRIHGTTRQRPLVVFENIEKNALIPLSMPPFDPPKWAECKVHPDHHIQFGKALYSVPTCHVGKTVTVRGDSKLVRVYVKGELVKTHKHMPEGKRSTDFADYPKELAPYAMRNPERMIQEAHRQSKPVGQFMEALLAGDFPWAKLRQAQKLLRLTNKYGHKRLDAACRRALYFELYNVKRVETIVLGELERERETAAPGSPVQGQLIEFLPRFLRPETSFNHNAQDPQQHPQQQESQHHGDPAITEDCSEETEAIRPADHVAGQNRIREEDEAQ
jgi:transposase